MVHPRGGLLFSNRRDELTSHEETSIGETNRSGRGAHCDPSYMTVGERQSCRNSERIGGCQGLWGEEARDER